MVLNEDYSRTSLESLLTEKRILDAFLGIFEKYNERRPEAYSFALIGLGYKRVMSSYRFDWINRVGQEHHIYARQKSMIGASGKPITLKELITNFEQRKASSKDLDLLAFSVSNKVCETGSMYLKVNPDLTYTEVESKYEMLRLDGITIRDGQSEKMIKKALLIDSSVKGTFNNDILESERTTASFVFGEKIYSLIVDTKLVTDKEGQKYSTSCSIMSGEDNANVSIESDSNIKLVLEFSKAINNDLIFVTTSTNEDINNLKATDADMERKFTKSDFQDLLRKDAALVASRIKDRAISYFTRSGRYKINNGLLCDGLKCVPINSFLEGCAGLITKNEVSKLKTLEGFG